MNNKFWKGKRVIITGANGFLASHLTISLLENGAIVKGIIKEKIPLSLLNFQLKKKKYKNLDIIKGDITNYNFLKKLFSNFKPHFCFHVAAQAIVGKANKDPIPTFKTNILGTWNIMEVIRLFSPHTNSIVASSDKAYGEHKKLPYKEEAALQALHPYDASKACTDILTRTYAHTYNLAAVVTRCANLYGPGDLNFSRIIPDTIKSAILNKNPIIRSDGTPLRDYIFVQDAAHGYLSVAHALYLNKKRFNGQAFNIGSGRPISVTALVKLMLKLSKRKNLKPKILSKRKIQGEIDKQYLSIQKVKKLLNWKPNHTLTQGLKQSFTWYKTYLLK